MRFLKNPKFDPLEARTSGFTGSMGGKRVAGVVFGPKPTPDPNFIKIGVGGRTGVLHFLIFGLLRDAVLRLAGSVTKKVHLLVFPCPLLIA